MHGALLPLTIILYNEQIRINIGKEDINGPMV